MAKANGSGKVGSSLQNPTPPESFCQMVYMLHKGTLLLVRLIRQFPAYDGIMQTSTIHHAAHVNFHRTRTDVAHAITATPQLTSVSHRGKLGCSYYGLQAHAVSEVEADIILGVNCNAFHQCRPRLGRKLSYHVGMINGRNKLPKIIPHKLAAALFQADLIVLGRQRLIADFQLIISAVVSSFHKGKLGL